MLAFNGKVPAAVRRCLLGRPADYDGVLACVRVPVLVMQGTRDQVVLPAMSRHTLAQVAHARASFFEGIGHAPFHESSARFNAELEVFARVCATGQLPS